jgi:periplasmic protein TonB
MTALALQFPERQGIARWALSAVAIVAVHAAVIGALALWYTRTLPEENIIPAIAVSLVPVPSSSPQTEDLPVGPTMEQVEQTPPEPPKIEEQRPIERVEIPPPPPQPHAEVTLPKAPPKPAEKPRHVSKPPAPETSAPPRGERVGQFSAAASNNYNSLVVGQLERAKRYPPGAPSGLTSVAFSVRSDGSLLGAHVTRSSGNSVLDQAALDVVRRASPFPHFPPEMTQSQASFAWSLNFATR